MKSQLLAVWLASVAILAALAGCTVETAHAPEVEVIVTPTAVPTATFAPNTAVVFKRTGGIE